MKEALKFNLVDTDWK